MVTLLAKYYPILQFLHSTWRWAVLIAAIVSIVMAIRGLAGQACGRKPGVIYVGILDLQLLLGLLLYFASPLVASAWQNISAAMKQQELRFFAIEHLVTMLIAVILAHIGTARAKRASNDRSRSARLLLWHSLSFVVLLAGIPWWRPLFRLP